MRPIHFVMILILAGLGLFLYPAKRSADLTTLLKAKAVGTIEKIEVIENHAPTPETPFQDRLGNEVKLTDFKGNVVLVNFWATWCAPCRYEMPALQQLQLRLAGQDFKVITVSLDREGFPVMDAFFNEIGITELESYLDRSNRLSLEVSAIGLPTTLLLNKEGMIVAKMVGPAEWHHDEVVDFISVLLN